VETGGSDTFSVAEVLALPSMAGACVVAGRPIRHRLSSLQRLFGQALDRPEERLSMSLSLTALRLMHADRSLQSPPWKRAYPGR